MWFGSSVVECRNGIRIPVEPDIFSPPVTQIHMIKQGAFVQHQCPRNGHFLTIVTLIFNRDRKVELGTNRKGLSQGILVRNMKALTPTNQKIWPR